MSDLPAGWVDTTIGDVVVPKVEQRTPSADEDFIYIDISSVDRVTKKILNPQKLSGKDAPSRARQVVANGDVLVSMTRPNLNAVAMVSKELDGQIASTGFDVLRANNVESRWLYYLVRTNDFVTAMSDLVQGALYPAVRPRDIRNFEIPLAPLNEQKRIAEKLDSLLARVDSCQSHLERVPQILKRFRQSVLAAATSGRLTEDWREKHGLQTESRQIAFDDEAIEIPSHWEDSELYNVINPERPLCYGVVQPGEEAIGGIPLVRIQDLGNWKINTEDLRTVSPKIDTEYRRSRIKSGDLLLSVVGTIGRTAIVPSGFEANIARAIARISCREGVNPKWVNIWLSCDTLQWYLSKNSREVARKTLNLSELGIARVALPSSEEQAEIVRRVEKLFAYAERLEARYTSASEHVERLTPSLLAKAFRGEL